MKQYEFKSEFFKKIATEKNDNKGEIKDYSRVNFTEVINVVLAGASDQEISAISEDINSGNISLGMDAAAVNNAIANKDNDKIKKFIQDTNISLSIDVYGLDELSSEKFEEVKQLGCNIDKVYVNSGFDEAAKRGYTSDVYSKIIGNAEAMSKKAMSKVKDGASEKDKFKAIYAAVIKKAVYDRDAEKADGTEKQRISQNLQGYFVKGKCVCAGTADALVQMCKMNGIEAQYVQGKARTSKRDKACDHAWVRVKIDGKWYNCDPTWDAYSNGKVLPYFMKSDADFKSHEAWPYKPTYIRDAAGRQVNDKEYIDYEDADESIDISELEDFYDSESLGESLGGRSLSSNDIAKYQSGSRSLIDIIIDLLFNLGRRDSSDRRSIRNKFSDDDLNKLSKSSNVQDAVKEYADSLHVDTKDSSQDVSPKGAPKKDSQKREDPEDHEEH